MHCSSLKQSKLHNNNNNKEKRDCSNNSQKKKKNYKTQINKTLLALHGKQALQTDKAQNKRKMKKKKKKRRGTPGQNKIRRKERVGNQRKLQVVLINIKDLPPLSFIVLFLIRSWAGLNFGACE